MLNIAEKKFIDTTGQALGVNQNNDETTNNLSSIHEKIKDISNIVEVMTFNNGVSLSVTGKYTSLYLNGHLILNPKGIDLRFFPGKVKSVDINVTKGADDKYHHNIIFNNKERPVQKTTFASDSMIQNNDFKNYPINQQSGKLMEIDTTKSIEELWRSLTDIHHFYPMLEQKGISKINALRSVPKDLAFQVKKESVSELLNCIYSKNEKFMIFVGNDSVIQIYTGKIDNIIQPGKYAQLNKIIVHGTTEENKKAVCKISPESIAQVWVVNKFSEGKTVTSLEVFDKDDNHIIQFYGWRKRGQEQSNIWQGIINNLPRDDG